MADRRKALFGRYPLPEGAASADGHIHFGVAFHPAGQALVGLLLRLLKKIPVEE